jgi:hypothetical protein
VNELRAEFDGMIQTGIKLSEDPPAYAISSFDDFDPQASAGEINCSRKSGCAGSDDEDVR